MKLEEKLVSLRKAKGLSQMKLAEMMNVSRQAISRWEVGAAVPSTVAVLICAVFLIDEPKKSVPMTEIERSEVETDNTNDFELDF